MADPLSRIRLAADALVSLLKVKSAQQKLHEAKVNRAVEQVVDQINPRLRAARGYRRRLYPVVEETLAYAERLAAEVPTTLLVDRQTWATDPKVNAMFGNVDRLRRVLTGPAVREYVKAHPLGGDCFAVLASMPDVRDQLGMELAGEALQRDVRQTTVSFSDHEVGLVGDQEEQVREQIAATAHEILVSIAVEEILERESRIVEIEDRLRIVRIKLRAVDASTRGSAFITEGSDAHLQEIESLRTRVAELEKELEQAKAGMDGLDDYLERLVEQLGNPETHLGLQEVKVRLDRMNVVRADSDDATSTELSFHRVIRGGKPARVVHLIRFPRSELLEDEQRLHALRNYLD